MTNYQAESNQQMLILGQMYQKYKKLILVALVIVLTSIAIRQYWKYNMGIKISEASNLYQQMQAAYFKNDTAILNDTGEQLIKSYKGTPYYQASALLLAKSAVNQSNLDKAAEYLNLVVAQKNSKNPVFDIAVVRLANVMQGRGQLDEALKLLDNKPNDKNYVALYEEAKGDLYLAKGDIKQAKASYKASLQSLPDGTQAPIIQMKLVDLGIGDDDAS